jgi:hypothetical protein
VETIERDLETLRRLIPSIRSREDLLHFKADIHALRLAAKNGTSTDTPALKDFNERSARRKIILASIEEKAKLQPEIFKTYLWRLKLTQLDEAFKYADLIESLSKNCTQWKQLLLDELDRVLLYCDRTKSKSPFFALQGFADLESCRDSAANGAIRRRYAVALRSTSPSVRRAVIELAEGYMLSADAELRNALTECLSDPDWKVRARSEALLQDQQLLPLGYQTSLIDRIRRRLFSSRR